MRALGITFFLMTFFLLLSVFTEVVPQFSDFDVTDTNFDEDSDVKASGDAVKSEAERLSEQSYAKMDEIKGDSGVLEIFATLLYGIKMFFGVVLSTLRYMLLIFDLLLAYGVPAIIAGVIQTLIWINYVITLGEVFNLIKSK